MGFLQKKSLKFKNFASADLFEAKILEILPSFCFKHAFQQRIVKKTPLVHLWLMRRHRAIGCQMCFSPKSFLTSDLFCDSASDILFSFNESARPEPKQLQVFLRQVHLHVCGKPYRQERQFP